MRLKPQGPQNSAFWGDFLLEGRILNFETYPKHPFPSWKKQFAPMTLFCVRFVSLKKIKLNTSLKTKKKHPLKKLMELGSWWNFPFKMVPFQGNLRIRPFNRARNRWPNQLSPWAGVHRGYLHRASGSKFSAFKTKRCWPMSWEWPVARFLLGHPPSFL